jgi:hypothetical protein
MWPQAITATRGVVTTRPHDREAARSRGPGAGEPPRR